MDNIAGTKTLVFYVNGVKVIGNEHDLYKRH